MEGKHFHSVTFNFLIMGKKKVIIYTAAYPAVRGWIHLHPTQGAERGEVILSCLFCWNPLQNVVWPFLFSFTVKGRLPGECSPTPADTCCIISSVTCCLLVSEIPKSPTLLVRCFWDHEMRRETFSAVVLPVALWFPEVSHGSPLLLRVWLRGCYFNNASFQHLPFFNLFCLASYFIFHFSLKCFNST